MRNSKYSPYATTCQCKRAALRSEEISLVGHTAAGMPFSRPLTLLSSDRSSLALPFDNWLRKVSKYILPVIFLLVMTACGYRFGRGEILAKYSTVCVPYAEGDNKGLFTAALVRAVAAQGALIYRSSGADLALRVSLLPCEDTNIGFINAPPDKGDNKASKIIVANEARLTLTANVSLIDRRTGVCILGPLFIRSSIDYDFEPDLSNVNKHEFSLGQLEMHNLAQDAAFFPLYTLLAEKIVDYVNNSW